MNKNTGNLIAILLIALIVLFTGCAGEEDTTPEATQVSTPTPEETVSTPTGHEQAGEPNESYPGLADIFDKKSGTEVITGSVQIEREGIMLSGFLVQPSISGRYPGIIMIHEWWGLNEQVKSMADILAREGYVVLAVDLFDGNVATTIEGAQANLRENPDEETLPKMQAGLEYLRELPDVDPMNIASLGWCYGGGQSFLLGINEDLNATVIYYGRISTDTSDLIELREPVLGIFGAEDTSIPVDDVREFERLLKAQGTSADIYIYEGAGHAFANPTNTEAFRKVQAIDAWNKTIDFLNLNLKVV
ncbi:MAG: dienelactone hydrolase family protein [Candidatus Methanoperedens sp.]